MTKKNLILGIIGGGQLGRMSALAAARLGIRTHILAPEAGCPASQVTDLFTCAAYTDKDALEKFARSVDAISYEFENIPPETIAFLETISPVRPGARLLEISQDRILEKSFLNDIGIKTAPWAPAFTADDVKDVMTRWQTPECIVKTARFGYDGKGQIKQRRDDDFITNWNKLDTDRAVIEGIIDFAYECSIIVARGLAGEIFTFPVTVNDHKDHILSQSHVPASMPQDLQSQAAEIAIRLAEAVDLVGLLALELFVTKDGELIANEIAPRTHNSGHWTMDGCNVSQFEQHVRAVCGLPLMEPVQHSAVTMINLIGDDIEKLPEYYRTRNACIHLYGKAEARPGRKMGHVNLLKPLEKN